MENESDLRAWIRAYSGGLARWIEPSMGSTIGMPDCWIPIGECGVVVWLELKIGTIKGEILSYDIRPEQRKEMRRMISDACAVGVLVGVKGTADIIAFFPSPEVLGGRVNFPRALAEGHGFAFEGLNPETLKSCCRFIFFKSCEIWPSLDRV